MEVSDLTTGDPSSEAFIGGQTVNVAGQESKDLFQGNVIGVIKDAEVIYNEEKLTGKDIITDTLGIFANNLLTGKKPTSNILVPVTGLVENTLSKVSGGITDGFIKATGLEVNNNNVSSQGQNLSTTNFQQVITNEVDVGNGRAIPTNGSRANSPAISDYNTYPQKSDYGKST